MWMLQQFDLYVYVVYDGVKRIKIVVFDLDGMLISLKIWFKFLKNLDDWQFFLCVYKLKCLYELGYDLVVFMN